MGCIAGARPRFFGAGGLPVLDTDGAVLGSERRMRTTGRPLQPRQRQVVADHLQRVLGP